MSEICIIYNPTSGRFRPKTLNTLRREFEECGHSVQVQASSLEGNRFSKSLSLICVMGGDGTLSLVTSSLIDQGLHIPLCIFPRGTINLVARELRYPKNPKYFARHIAAELNKSNIEYHTVPILMSSIGPIMCSFSIGPDSIAAHNISLALKRRIGRFAYAISMAKIFLKWPRQKIGVTAKKDGKTVAETQASALFLAKGRLYAGPWSFAHQASLTSRVFHILLLTNATKADFVRFVLSLLFKRKLRNSEHFQTLEATELELETSGDVILQIDGDAMVAGCPRIWLSDSNLSFLK